MARPRKSGRRTKSGRLSVSAEALAERNPPNGRALALQERFRHFRGDSSIGTEMTCAGRLMLVGAFDGMEAPAENVLAILMAYSHAYWRNYSVGVPGIAQYGEREPRGFDNLDTDPHGEWFGFMDERLRGAGRQSREAVHAVTVDRHWFPDEDVDWVSRIINSRIVQKRAELVKAKRPLPEGLCVAGELACDSDWAMLKLLRHGAEALLGDRMRRAA